MARAHAYRLSGLGPPLGRLVALLLPLELFACATSPAPGAVYRGALELGAGSHEKLAELSRIDGDLLVRDWPHAVLSMPQLEEITGRLVIEGTALAQVNLPRLTRVGSVRVTGNPQLATLELPALMRVTHGLEVRDNGGLQRLLLPALSQVGGEVRVADEAELLGIELGQLRGGNLALHHLPKLLAISISEEHGAVRAEGLAALGQQGRASLGLEPQQQAAPVTRAPQAPSPDQLEPVLRCIQDAAALGTIAPGTFTLRLGWTLTPEGNITEPRVLGPTPLALSLPTSACIQEHMSRWRLPPSAPNELTQEVTAWGPLAPGAIVGPFQVAAVWGRYLQPHAHTVTAVAVDEAARRVITASLDESLRLWDLEDGRLLQILRGHQGPVRAVTGGPAGLFISAGDDGRLCWWHAADGQLQQAVELGGALQVLRWGRGGVFVGDNRGRVRWVAAGAEPREIFSFPEAEGLAPHETLEVVALVMADGDLIAASQWGHTYKVQLRGEGAPEAGPATGLHLEVPSWGRLSDLARSPRGWLAASGGWGSAPAGLRWWAGSSGSVRNGPAAVGFVRSLGFHGEEHLLAAGDEGLWRVELASGAAQPLRADVGLSALAVAESAVVAGGERGEVVWVKPGQPQPPHGLPVLALSASDEGALVAALHAGGVVVLWSGSEDRVLGQIEAHAAAMELSRDGRSLAAVDERGTITLWDVPSRVALWTHRLPEPSTLLRFTVDGRRIAAGTQGGEVRLLDAGSGNIITGARREGHPVLDISGDGVWVLASDEGRALVWSLQNPDADQSWPTVETPTMHSRFLPNGRVLLVGYRDLRIWEVGADEPLAALHGHGREIVNVALDSEGRRAWTMSLDGTVRAWDLTSFASLHVLDLMSQPGQHATAGLWFGEQRLVGLSTGVVLKLERSRLPPPVGRGAVSHSVAARD